LDFLKELMPETPEYIKMIAIAMVAVLFVAIMLLIIRKINKNKTINKKLKISDNIDAIRDLSDYENKYTQVLQLIRKYVKGDGYFLYLFEKGKNRYKLKRVLFESRNMDLNHGGVDVSYGRIMPYAKESYAPPLVFSGAVIPKRPSLLMEGRFPVLVLPVKEDKGFISISIKKRKFSKNKPFIEYIAGKLGYLFQDFVEHQNENLAPFEKETDYKDERSEKDILDFSLFVMGSKAGFFIKIEIDYGELFAISGISPKTEDRMRNDSNLLVNIETFVDKTCDVIMDKSTREFSAMPSYLAEEGFKGYIIEKVEKGIIVFCYSGKPEESYLKEYRRNAVELLTLKMAEKSKTNRKKNTNEFYIGKMKALARAIDQVAPYSVGFSELMSHYASVITKEMKLGPEESKNIKLATYFSNIGVTILPDYLLLKEGVYTEDEYEMTKVHSEAGALFVVLLIGNHDIEKYIRYHHERMDGLGYPEGLNGKEIPLGARIIAVVQTFSSKIKGRNYREPVSFDKIISTIEQEAGKSLDPEVVASLVNWFKKKQENPRYRKHTLGPCWEMRCATEEICASCPVYKRTDKYCWQFEGNNCLAHGNSCDTCHVYTEFVNRNKILGLDNGEDEI